MAKKKFDTNPLDPTFPERVQKEAETVALPKNAYETADFTPPDSEKISRVFLKTSRGAASGFFAKPPATPRGSNFAWRKFPNRSTLTRRPTSLYYAPRCSPTKRRGGTRRKLTNGCCLIQICSFEFR